MKRFLKFIFIVSISVFGLFYANINKSAKVVASANSYDDIVLTTFSDNENLEELISDNSELATNFNVLNHTNLELYDQSPYGTCYATSLAQTINLCYEYRTKEHIRISAAALALQLKDLFFDEGSYCLEIIENSYNLDYVSEFDFPYEMLRLYYNDLMSSNNVVDFNFKENEILDIEEYYAFPQYARVCSVDVKNQYLTAIKRALVRDGALSVGFDFCVNQYGNYLVYDSDFTSPGGHAMTIVGYDDNFSASNFYTTPSRDGAFIFLNSWGSDTQTIYVSYDDIFEMHFIYGIADFIDVDDRAETISNVENAYYEMTKSFRTEELSESIEFGYQITNSTSQSYLTQIDLQPLYNTITGHNFYFDATDIYIYVNSSTSDLKYATEFVGRYDISAGVNKIKLETPIFVGETFAIKIEVFDDEYTYGYFDRASLGFETLYNNNGDWLTESYSNHNYNLIKTPFFVRVSLSDDVVYDISEEINFQTATTNAVVFDLFSSETISDVEVLIFKNQSVAMTYTSFELTQINANDLFEINSSNSEVSIKAKNFIQGTFKVVIKVNEEKQFIKFLRFDDGIILTTMKLDCSFNKSSFALRVYDTSLSLDEINVIVPSAYYMVHTNNLGLKFDLLNVFNYDETTATIKDSYSIDTSGRIAKATIVFENSVYKTTRTIVINFRYETRSEIIYVTHIPNATHSNQQFISAGVPLTLKNATASNHTFMGWYTSSDFLPADRLYQIPALAEGQIVYLYAKFEEKSVDCVVKKISYDKTTNILTLSLNFEDYNLNTYDVIEFTNISHQFKSTINPTSFSILKTNQYNYQIYIDSALMNVVNTITFDVKIKRHAYRDYVSSFPYTVLSQSVSVNDMLKITINSSENGKIYNNTNLNNMVQLGNGDIYMPYGSFLSLKFEPNKNCYISSIVINGSALQQISDNYYLSSIKQNYMISVVFVATSYDIIASVVGNGSINQGFTQTVGAGGSITYIFTPDEGAYFVSALIDGTTTITDVSSYTFSNIQSNHTIVVTFANYKYTIQTTIVGEGSIGQPNTKIVEYGNNVIYEFQADEGYTLKQINVDGVQIELTNAVPFVYEFKDVKESHSVYVLFQKNQININISVNGNGCVEVYKLSDLSSKIQTIENNYEFVLSYGDGLKFNNIAYDGNKLVSFSINGTAQTATSEIITENIIEDLIIEITYEIQKFKLTLTINGSGTSNKPSLIEVGYGESVEYEFTATTGYEISSVKINNIEQGQKTILNISNITENKNIVVEISIQVFKINWFNYNGSLIAITEVNYGNQPVATFKEPTKSASGIYVYRFIGWNSEIDGSGTGPEVASSNANYYAQYETKLIEYEIKASAGSNGNISPSGNVQVEYGKKQTFEMIPDAGYHVYRIYVDGKIIENAESITFENVKESHTISVTFKRNDYKAFITNNDDKGEIIGNKWFESGERAVYKINPKEGYEVNRVIVNGKEVSLSENTFVIENVSEEISIVVEYKKTNSSNSPISNFKNIAIIVAVVIVVGGVAAGLYFVIKKIKVRKYEDYDDNNY